jgi:hypothetical protein
MKDLMPNDVCAHKASGTPASMENLTEGLGMNGHFQVLAADERFTGMRIGLYRNPGEELRFGYEIVAEIEDQNLDVAAASPTSLPNEV